MDTTLPSPAALQALALTIPLCFALAAAVMTGDAAARAATRICAICLGLAGLFAVAVGVAPAPGSYGLARADVVSATMLALVCGLGLAVVHYARTYLAGEAGQSRFVRWLLATLAAVTTLVVANHLVVLAAAWTLTSVALHKLLTYYGDRPAALVAAHKKFLVSRLADLCLWSALALIYDGVGSLRLDALAAHVEARGALSPGLQIAAVLCVVAAALKSAQLPFHGWLTQVMEAPTPVSALLHAGVVNLGGLLMIRLAPMMALAPAAQLLLVAIGMTTAVLASLISMTRVSVKVALAWSTCAQMGLMLVQCGLGAWHLALLHLVAHSLYKAHAFLAAGGAVEAWRVGALAPPAPAPTPRRFAVGVLAVLAGAALVLAAARVVDRASVDGAALAVHALLVSLALAPMLCDGATARGVVVLRALSLAALYAACHAGAARLWPAPAAAGPAIGWAIVALGLGALFCAQSLVTLWPRARIARTLHTWLYAGLYLDERFTRLTFRLWPPRLTRPAERPLGRSVEVSW